MKHSVPKNYDLKQDKNAAPGRFQAFCADFFHHIDLLQIIPMLILLTIGAIFIYGIGQQVGGFAAATFWKRHLIYMGIGLAFWIALSFIDYRWFGPASAVLYPVSILLLVYVLVYGVKYFGARSWIEFGPVNFQPAEIAKLAVVLACAWILSMKGVDVNHFLWMLLLLAVVALPFILIKMQPDLGTALILIPVVGFTAFAARLKWRYLIILGAIALIILPAAYFSLKDYQRDRIMVFLDPERDPQNRGWNQLQAEMAIGSGGFTGKGFMQSTQNPMGYLPQTVSNSDFIFPVIAEETGFIGSLFVVLMFMLLLFSVLRTALLAADDFGRYLCVGVATVIFFHSVINIGMSIRLTPVTGLPLPLISYGGTFLVAMLVYLGIVHSIYVHREKRSIMDL